jgi:hypothetical protein
LEPGNQHHPFEPKHLADRIGIYELEECSMIKRLLFVIIVIVILSGVSGDWLARIPEIASSLWQQLMSIWTAIIAVSGST